MDEKQDRTFKIGQLLSGEADALSFDRVFAGEWEADGLSFSEIRFSGTVKDEAGILRLSGTAQCELTAPCARCLAPVRACHTEEVKGVVSTENASEDPLEEFFPVEGETIDLLAIAESALLPALPFRLLCREDCKGLCPVCGKDLNQGDCGCERKTVDVRLAGLADFFKE